MRIVSYADEPGYRGTPSFVSLRDGWPRFLLHDAVSNEHWGRLYDDFPEFQFALLDGDEVLAEETRSRSPGCRPSGVTRS